MEIEQEYFRHFIKWYTEDVHGPTDGGQTTLSQEYGCSNQYVNMIVTGKKKPSYKTQMRFISKLKYTREEALRIGEMKMKGVVHATTPSITMTGQATTQPPNRRKTDLETHAEQIHHSVIGTFHNKELALKVNELLVDLESLEGDDGLKAAIEWAKYKIHEARKAKGGAGKTGTMGE